MKLKNRINEQSLEEDTFFLPDFLDYCMARYWYVFLPGTGMGILLGLQIDRFAQSQPLIAILYACGQMDTFGALATGFIAVYIPLFILFYFVLKLKKK